MTFRFRTRLNHHSVLLLVTIVLLTLIIKWIPGDDVKYLWSMGTGYVSIIFLAISLIIGPFNVFTRVANPVSTDLRRDVGIWCGLVGLIHIVMGIQVHMGNIWLYFFKSVEGESAYQFRDDFFGIANYAGLIGGLVLILLLLLSNDLSLRRLKPKRWKNLQRWNYLLFALVLMHGIMYMIIEKRIAVIVILFSVIMLLPMISQLIGFSIKRKTK